MKKLEYKLQQVVEPVINGNVLVGDKGAFGITLTYEVSHYTVWFTIGKFNICNPFAYKVENKTYLRPLKKFWSTERERLPKNYWGMKSHPLCGVAFWWEVTGVYGYNHVPKLKEQVKNHLLIKRLRAATLKDETELKKLGFDPKNFHFYQQSNSNQNE